MQASKVDILEYIPGCLLEVCQCFRSAYCLCDLCSYSDVVLFILQLKIREEWELEQKKLKEVEEEERRQQEEKLQKQVRCTVKFIFNKICQQGDGGLLKRR